MLERWGAEDISGDLGNLCSTEQWPHPALARCTDVLCQFLSGGQGARARSDAWVLDSVFFVTASTVVG